MVEKVQNGEGVVVVVCDQMRAERGDRTAEGIQ